MTAFDQTQYIETPFKDLAAPAKVVEGVSFQDCTFENCRLVGVNWCNAEWDRSSLLKTGRVRFDSCPLDHALFIGLNLTGTPFKDCQLRGADFESANLTRADFHGADLAEARFAGCNLSEATFVGAQGYQINAAYTNPAPDPLLPAGSGRPIAQPGYHPGG